MIASGEKKEEYREIKPYWCSRLIESYDPSDGDTVTKGFDVVRFRNGYAKDAPTIDVEFVEIRRAKTGNLTWGWTKECFGIKLGKIITYE